MTNSNIKAVLFDADGVLTLPEEVFSIVYARSHGLDTEPFEQFFRNDWLAIVTGKKDLKEAISERPDLWQWHGSIDDLLQLWFKTEDVRNEELVELIRTVKSQGTPCYLATDQEKYRAKYMQEVMFTGLFDGYFVSADLGTTKTDPKFFKLIIEKLQKAYPGLQPQNITFFDDSQSKVDTACSVGINGQLFKSIDQVRQILSQS